MKLLFCLLVAASATEHFRKQLKDFEKCTTDRPIRSHRCVTLINQFKQECYELNTQPLPDGNKHKEWVNE